MTEINVVVDENKKTKIPTFDDLENGQYFKIISDYYDEDMHIYVKTPCVRNAHMTNFTSSTSPEFYNSYNITKNKFEWIDSKTCCDLINKVEIHI